MATKRVVGTAVGIAALLAAFVAGALVQSDGGASLSGLIESARDKIGPQFARPIELQIWSQGDHSREPEPIVDPTAIDAAIGPCVAATTSIEHCAEQRRALVASFKQATREPGATRTVAACLSDGCAPLVNPAPANACLFWTFHASRWPERVAAADRAAQERSCAQARSGGKDQAAQYGRIWNRFADSR